MHSMSIFKLELKPAHLMSEDNRGQPLSRAETSDRPGLY